jgi:methylmalonyl-CoA/ethylmalonyl-CoA epimerase
LAVKRIDHIAIVVSDIEAAKAFYEGALGMTLERTEQIDEQEVIVAFLPAGDSQIELVQPINDTSGVAKYLSKRGPGIHHICVEVDDLDARLAMLKEKGVRLINETPTIGSGGKRIAFIHPESAFGVLVELYESSR